MKSRLARAVPGQSAPTFYDVQAVAAMFHMSRMTVYRAIHDGELPAVQIRGRLLVPAQAIDALIEAALGSDASTAIGTKGPADQTEAAEVNDADGQRVGDGQARVAERGR